jgi:hypothetical protein
MPRSKATATYKPITPNAPVMPAHNVETLITDLSQPAIPSAIVLFFQAF